MHVRQRMANATISRKDRMNNNMIAAKISTDVYTLPVAGVFGTTSGSLIESVDFYVGNLQIYAVAPVGIGGFIGQCSTTSIYRSNMVANGRNTFALIDNDFGSIGGFAGAFVMVPSDISSTVCDCSASIANYKNVLMGCSNSEQAFAEIGGFCGTNNYMIDGCKLVVSGNKYVVIGIPLGINSGIGPDESGLFGTNQIGAGGFCGYSDHGISGCSAKFCWNNTVIIGEDLYTARNLFGYEIGIIIGGLGVGVGGFIGAPIRDSDFAEVYVKGCELIMENNKDVVVGTRIKLDGTVSASLIGSTDLGASLGIGGFFGLDITTDTIEKCSEKWLRNGRVMIGFDICMYGGEEGGNVIGVLGTSADTVDGIGLFGGVINLSYQEVGAVTTVIQKCSGVFEGNGSVGSGIAIDLINDGGGDNVVGGLDVGTSLIEEGSRGIAGIGGFFGLIYVPGGTDVVPNIIIAKCGLKCCGNSNVMIGIGVCVGSGGVIGGGSIIATVGATPQVFNASIAAFEGGGIGGFGGLSTSVYSMTLTECVCEFGSGSIVIGAGLKQKVTGAGSGTVLESGIGGWWGEVQGSIGAFVFDNSDGASI